MAFHRLRSFLAAFLSLSALMPLCGQTPCGAPPAVLQSSAPNIFSEQQEQWLGDATAEQIITRRKGGYLPGWMLHWVIPMLEDLCASSYG